MKRPNPTNGTVDPQPATAGFSIGVLGQMAGVTPEAIRYYEREAVLPLPARRGTGRYRQYSPTDVERLSFVRRARDLGFSLDEVRELLILAAGDPTGPCGNVNRVARTHLAQVEVKLSQLARLRVELTKLIAACDKNAALAECTLLGALSGSDRHAKAIPDK